MTFHFFIQDVVGPRLGVFYVYFLSGKRKREQRCCGCRLWVQLGVWRETSILMMEMSPALLFEGRLMWKIPVQWEQSHHWSCVDNSHRVVEDTYDFIGWIRSPKVTLPPQKHAIKAMEATADETAGHWPESLGFPRQHSGCTVRLPVKETQERGVRSLHREDP